MSYFKSLTYTLKCRSMIDSEFIFGCSIKQGSNFLLLQVDVQQPQHQLLETPFFLHLIVWAPWSKTNQPQT